MSFPSMARTGQFQGPYMSIHISSGDTSSYVVGSSSGDTIITSSLPLSGVINALVISQISGSATGGYTLRVDGNTSTYALQSSNPFVFPLNIGFNTGFTISNNASGGSAYLTYSPNTP